jgi:hypothetical protein
MGASGREEEEGIAGLRPARMSVRMTFRPAIAAAPLR